MSKNKKKDANPKGDVPLDFQVESKNLQYTITLKDMEIDTLKQENLRKKQYILELEKEIQKLKKDYIQAYKLENTIKGNNKKIEKQEREIENLNNQIKDQKNKNEEEKKQIEQNFKDEIQQLKVFIESSSAKVEMANQLSNENQELLKEVDKLKNEQKGIIDQHIAENKRKDIKNQIKFTNLKNKMKEKIDQIQAKETELNVQYMDVSTKLTLLQNHQLLIQLEYQSQQMEELAAKKEELEKKVFELTKDIGIHQEVELSLAEKNKNLKKENERLKNSININISKSPKSKNLSNNFNSTEDDKSPEFNHQMILNTNSYNSSTAAENNNSNYINNLSSNINNFSNKNNSSNNYTKMVNLERKVINLEKKLIKSKKECNLIKDKNEHTEKVLKSYEKKYSGLFKFFEESLELFFNDQDLVSNQELFVNIDSIKKCDFSKLNKEEKYSALIILMKYLMPLMDSSNILKQNQNSNNGVNNINLNFYLANKKNYKDDGDIKQLNNINKKNKIGKIMPLNSLDNFGRKNTIESLPTITNNNYGK
jgi:myosin heavy subunit